MSMQVDEFQRILNAGLGRAIIYLQQHDSSPYRDVILNAVLHNTAYDPQVEGPRAQYLYDVIQLTADVDFYRDAILSTLSKSGSTSWDNEQLGDLAALFAKAGDQSCRQIIYDLILDESVSSLNYDLLIEMDGINGLITLVDKIWQSNPNDRHDFVTYVRDDLFATLEQRDGEERARIELEKTADANPSVKEFVDRGGCFHSHENRFAKTQKATKYFLR